MKIRLKSNAIKQSSELSIQTNDSPSRVEHQVDGVVVPRARDSVHLHDLDHCSLCVTVGVMARPGELSDVSPRLSSGQDILMLFAFH